MMHAKGLTQTVQMVLTASMIFPKMAIVDSLDGRSTIHPGQSLHREETPEIYSSKGRKKDLVFGMKPKGARRFYCGAAHIQPNCFSSRMC